MCWKDLRTAGAYMQLAAYEGIEIRPTRAWNKLLHTICAKYTCKLLQSSGTKICMKEVVEVKMDNYGEHYVTGAQLCTDG